MDDLATGLLAMGLKRGDRVGMWGPNMKEWVITQFAAAKAGLILVSGLRWIFPSIALRISIAHDFRVSSACMHRTKRKRFSSN